MAQALERVVRITSKGQVTIPVEIRRELGVREGDVLTFRSRDGLVTVTSPKKPNLAELLAGFDPAKHRHEPEERPWDAPPSRRNPSLPGTTA
ncbi:MAG TPA: AbrB/MazE/SpoVT family DNA-binding domain-containing protein [Stellaceae bacterium]|nr:AbrB/MazE/SpoVT family DNA-binding domain-containing protein [Stellaceae bacterium]